MFTGLKTPCLLLDRNKFDQNIQSMKSAAQTRNLEFRPHQKTAKCREIAEISAANFGPRAMVSTLKEIEQLGGCGLTDFLYSVAVVPSKFDRISKLLSNDCSITVAVDSKLIAMELSRYCAETGVNIPAVIELNLDGHRSGVSPADNDTLCEIGRCLDEAGLLRGVMSHAGQSYGLSDNKALRDCADEEAAKALYAANVLGSAGLRCDLVSIGSTPTALIGQSRAGITELRAGVFMFFDLVQAGVGICSMQDIAISVLTSVISKNPENQALIIDAGWMAMSRDRGTAAQAVDYGYGQVCLEDGTILEDVIVTGAQQEHGIVQVRPGSSARLPDLAPGELLRILPNHACSTASAHDCYHVFSDNVGELEIWNRFNGW